MYIRLLLVFVTLVLAQAAHAETSNKDLMAACSDKTTVYGREDGEFVEAGEKLGGYCAGFLQGALYMRARSRACTPQSDDPDFLLSVYRQYMKDKGISESEDASETLLNAYRRILRCE